MKKIFLIVLLVSACFFAGAQTKTIWTCPMHSQIKKDKPGNCPICGMTLVKKTIKVAQPKAAPKKQEVKKPKQNMPVKKDTDDMDMKSDTASKTDMPLHDHEMDSTEDDVADQIPNRVYIVPGKIVRYDLYVKDTIAKFTG